MQTKLLFRASLTEENELNEARMHLNVIESRMDVKQDDLVIGRYSVLPYYRELEFDIKKAGGQLINSFAQHRYVADISNWYHDFEDLTPKTWFSCLDVPQNYSGSLVLKGETNSKKQLWKSHMFAANRKDMMRVYCNLMDDGLISQQNICIREFVALKNYGINPITEMPISKEFRIFVYNGKVVGQGFYWSNFIEGLDEKPNANDIPQDFLAEVISRAAPNINLFVVDVAEKTNGEWVVIEFNDGQMSGLSCVEPEELYENLAVEARKEYQC